MIDEPAHQQSAIQASLNSCYRAGWPQPDDVVRGVERFSGEPNEDFAARIASMREAHRTTMARVVVDAMDTSTLDRLFKLGPLAATNFNLAMYILGYHEER